VKRSSLSPTLTGIDATTLHAYYTAVLKRTAGDVFTPVSRSEYADLLGLLETTGLISLSLSGSPPTSPTKGARRSISRSSSFSGGVAKAAKDQTVRLSAGTRADEVLRGLGISGATEDMDPLQEEVKTIWTREIARTARESRHLMSPKKVADVFDDACED